MFQTLVLTESPAEPVKLSDQTMLMPLYVGGVPAATRAVSAAEAKTVAGTRILQGVVGPASLIWI